MTHCVAVARGKQVTAPVGNSVVLLSRCCSWRMGYAGTGSVLLVLLYRHNLLVTAEESNVNTLI